MDISETPSKCHSVKLNRTYVQLERMKKATPAGCIWISELLPGQHHVPVQLCVPKAMHRKVEATWGGQFLG